MSQPADTPAAEFHRKLGLFDATMLVAGSMIGSGIFLVSSDIARDVGSAGWVLVLWAVTGVLTVIGALSYAELAAMFPSAGGQYVFLREAYGPLFGFLYGWTCFLVIQTGFVAAVAVAFANYLGELVPALGPGHVLWRVADLGIDLYLPVPWLPEASWPRFFHREQFTISAGHLVAVALVVLLTALNTRGIELGRWVQNVFTVAKILSLALLVGLGLFFAADPEAVALNRANAWGRLTATGAFGDVSRFVALPALAGLLVLCGAMVGPLFSSDAWNNVTFVAAEIKRPQRNLPWGLCVGTVLVTVLYLLVNVTYLAALPVHGDAHGETAFARGIDHARQDRVATAVLEQVSPRLGVPLMALAIMVSTFGCNNGLILMGARLYYAMARDGLFFRSVGTLNPRGVPAAGLVLQAAWSTLLIFTGSYSELLDYVIFAALVFYILTVAAVFVLRRTRPDHPRPYRALGYPLVPAVYIVLCAVIMLALLVVRPVFSWPSFFIVLSGIPVYFLWRGRPVVSPR
jgi:APA family basic amino acid/polyamine antiporter